MSPPEPPFEPTGDAESAESTDQIVARLAMQASARSPWYQGLPSWVPIVASIMGTGGTIKLADWIGLTALQDEVAALEERIDELGDEQSAMLRALETISSQSQDTYDIVNQAHPPNRFGITTPQ